MYVAKRTIMSKQFIQSAILVMSLVVAIQSSLLYLMIEHDKLLAEKVELSIII